MLHAGRRLSVGQGLGHVLEEEVRIEGDHLVEAEQLVHLPGGRSARPEEHHGEGRRRREGAEDEALGAALLEERVVQPEGEVVVDLHEEALRAAQPRRGRRQTLVVLGDSGKFYRRPMVVVAVVAVVAVVSLVGVIIAVMALMMRVTMILMTEIIRVA